MNKGSCDVHFFVWRGIQKGQKDHHTTSRDSALGTWLVDRDLETQYIFTKSRKTILKCREIRPDGCLRLMHGRPLKLFFTGRIGNWTGDPCSFLVRTRRRSSLACSNRPTLSIFDKSLRSKGGLTHAVVFVGTHPYAPVKSRLYPWPTIITY